MIPIITSHHSLKEQAKHLAQQWGFQFSDIPDSSYYLQLTPDGLQLIQSTHNSPGPIMVDFTAGQVAHRRQFGGGKGQVIAKAVALNKLKNPLILDATAGMGKDAFVFASLGARVIMMERSPISAALLQDGLERARQDNEISEIIQRMQLIPGDARFLNSNPEQSNTIILPETPDIIYLDPMFPHRKKSALVKKEMLAFQHLIGDDNDSDDLLPVCQNIAKKRVVVKRPIKAPCLNNQKPSLSMKMKKHRFDIYLC